jgi:hypothetical protein
MIGALRHQALDGREIHEHVAVLKVVCFQHEHGHVTALYPRRKLRRRVIEGSTDALSPKVARIPIEIAAEHEPSALLMAQIQRRLKRILLRTETSRHDLASECADCILNGRAHDRRLP